MRFLFFFKNKMYDKHNWIYLRGGEAREAPLRERPSEKLFKCKQ